MALVILTIAFASCEKHDFFDENTITGAVGPEAYWYEVGEMAKAGESVEFKAQYYSSVDSNDDTHFYNHSVCSTRGNGCGLFPSHTDCRFR